jgi:serine/threonine protein phosphatase PrpC
MSEKQWLENNRYYPAINEKKLTSIFTTDKEIFDYLLFTIAIVSEDADNFYVTMAGDSAIIYEIEGMYDLVTVDQKNMPEYYAYNYIQDKSLMNGIYEDGIKLVMRKFPKSYFTNVGVATDGIEHASKEALKEIYEIFTNKRTLVALKKCLNRYESELKDDISIVM